MILVLARGDDANRFHTYVEEILLTEGYPWFRRLDLARAPLDPAVLAEADVVIAASIAYSAEECQTLLRHVESGGRLVALRPPLELARSLGLEPHNPVHYHGQTFARAMADRWVRLNPASPLASGAAATDLQFHGRADLYEWSGEESAVVAHLAPFIGQPAAFPAVVATARGQGRVVVYSFDLATATVLFHQGHREQSSVGSLPDHDGDAMFKPNDLFAGFLDERLRTVPQADVHQDIFVRLLEWLTADHRPIPRLWYFPDRARAVAFFNGDGDNMRSADLRNVIEQVERFGVPFTTYVMTDNYPVLEPAWEAELRARGHGFGQHPWAGPMPSLEQMRAQLRRELSAFADRYGHRPVSYRGHSVVWVGWTEMASYLAEDGIRLDTNFAPLRYFKEGYLNGSGLPVKFMDEQGRLIDLYEQCTLSTDDGWLTDKVFYQAYSVEECIAASRRLLEEAVERYHTVYHPYFHPIATAPDSLHTQPWLTAMLGYCRKLGVPCVQDEAWIGFNDARRAMQLEDVSYDDDPDGRLTFTLRAEHPVAGLTIALPGQHGGRSLAGATVDGDPVACPVDLLEGRRQGLVSLGFSAGERRRLSVVWR